MRQVVNLETNEITFEDDAPPSPQQPVPIPTTVSMRQARLVLLQFGLLATVEGAIAQGSEADKIEWEYATEVNRNTPLVQNMKVGLNLSENDLNNLFTLASTL